MKLDEAISDFEDEDEDIKFACEWAKKRHDETYALRKHSGDPYWEHPEGVAKLAIAYDGTQDEIIAAICHDTLEDTAATYDELEVLFGKKVADLVFEVTNDRDEINKLGKEKYINRELLNLSDSALFVKLCDIYYNILDYPSKEQRSRMVRNIIFLSRHRKVRGKNKELLDDLLSTINF